MISAERFLEQQGLQPVSSEVGGLALSCGGRPQAGRTEFDYDRTPSIGGNDTPRRARHARHSGRVAVGVSRIPDDPNDLDACREAALIRVRLIDDEAYAQSAVRYCASRLMGYRGAVMELKRKGVDRQLAQRVCDEAESQGVFAEAAWELGRRTARKTAGLDVEVRKRRFWSAGGRKGHNLEVLRKIAQELFV